MPTAIVNVVAHLVWISFVQVGQAGQNLMAAATSAGARISSFLFLPRKFEGATAHAKAVALISALYLACTFQDIGDLIIYRLAVVRHSAALQNGQDLEDEDSSAATVVSSKRT